MLTTQVKPEDSMLSAVKHSQKVQIHKTARFIQIGRTEVPEPAWGQVLGPMGVSGDSNGGNIYRILFLEDKNVIQLVCQAQVYNVTDVDI